MLAISSVASPVGIRSTTPPPAWRRPGRRTGGCLCQHGTLHPRKWPDSVLRYNCVHQCRDQPLKPGDPRTFEGNRPPATSTPPLPTSNSLPTYLLPCFSLFRLHQHDIPSPLSQSQPTLSGHTPRGDAEASTRPITSLLFCLAFTIAPQTATSKPSIRYLQHTTRPPTSR